MENLEEIKKLKSSINRIKQKLAWRKLIVRRDPKAVCTQEEWQDYLAYKRDLETNEEIWKTKGMSKGKTLKFTYAVPQPVYDADPDYWQEIMLTRDFTRHPEFIISKP